MQGPEPQYPLKGTKVLLRIERASYGTPSVDLIAFIMGIMLGDAQLILRIINNPGGGIF